MPIRSALFSNPEQSIQVLRGNHLEAEEEQNLGSYLETAEVQRRKLRLCTLYRKKVLLSQAREIALGSPDTAELALVLT
jgi:hypothetical protein